MGDHSGIETLTVREQLAVHKAIGVLDLNSISGSEQIFQELSPRSSGAPEEARATCFDFARRVRATSFKCNLTRLSHEHVAEYPRSGTTAEAGLDLKEW